MFHDGSIKTREQMHREQNQRAEEQNRLTAEESQFPRLNQTLARHQAYARMLARIEALRRNESMSIIAKQTEKANAESEYWNVLHAQQLERARAETLSTQSARR